MNKDDNLKELKTIPGIGDKIANLLLEIGVKRVVDLKGRDPEELYHRACVKRGEQIDRCLLYVFRCAVYFASHKKHDPKKLLWWNWKDKK